MAKRLIRIFAIVAALQFVVAVIAFSFTRDRAARAVLGMGIGLFVFWIIPGGIATVRFRDPIRHVVQSIRLPWQLKFILQAIVLALIEEAITVSLTNCAPWFGVTTAQARITASPNYFDVVLTSSVVLFVPMFCIWAAVLSRFDIAPEAVLLVWGLDGTMLETVAAGPGHLLEAGMWVFVYGLMIYLPAYSISRDRQARAAQWWHYPAIFLVVLLGIVPGGILATIFRHVLPHRP